MIRYSGVFGLFNGQVEDLIGHEKMHDGNLNLSFRNLKN